MWSLIFHSLRKRRSRAPLGLISAPDRVPVPRCRMVRRDVAQRSIPSSQLFAVCPIPVSSVWLCFPFAPRPDSVSVAVELIRLKLMELPEELILRVLNALPILPICAFRRTGRDGRRLADDVHSGFLALLLHHSQIFLDMQKYQQAIALLTIALQIDPSHAF